MDMTAVSQQETATVGAERPNADEDEGTHVTMRAGEVYEHPFERLVVRAGTAESQGRS